MERNDTREPLGLGSASDALERFAMESDGALPGMDTWERLVAEEAGSLSDGSEDWSGVVAYETPEAVDLGEALKTWSSRFEVVTREERAEATVETYGMSFDDAMEAAVGTVLRSFATDRLDLIDMERGVWVLTGRCGRSVCVRLVEELAA